MIMKKLLLTLAISLFVFSSSSHARPCYAEYQQMVKSGTASDAIAYTQCMKAQAVSIDG